ncbi:hypothetical protein [Paenibacillus sp. MMS20-IR301]|uniref:hypothetical protein n=1 Tax=Paenibacillus sp. MMS20-IR301 TaxID=2895946 RepID=UPI0028E7F160|nr:hypothetical protein [Paenibacillus sp. MMS20-IR301]WNS46420.1 hypothetical protein LOS79_14545 [Paenibacillus sp. MMS20-IR301]
MMVKIAQRFQDEAIRLHYELEFKRLERMYLRQEQISEIKKYIPSANNPVSQKHLEALEMKMARCITSTLKLLFEAGYGQEMKRRGYL